MRNLGSFLGRGVVVTGYTQFGDAENSAALIVISEIDAQGLQGHLLCADETGFEDSLISLGDPFQFVLAGSQEDVDIERDEIALKAVVVHAAV